MLNKIALALTLAAGHAFAAAQNPSDIVAPNQGSAYLTDSRGVIARNGQGMCWRTGYWTPAAAVPGCDGELVPPVVNPTAPAIVQPPPVVAQAGESASPPPVAKACDFTVTLQSDQTFGFNQARLTPAARKRLDDDVLARLSSCAKVDRIAITGHTDRLGSHPYNQKLSERRAQAVTSYLQQKGTPAGLIDTRGLGKTQAVQACDDKLSRARLIACLAPNRRVTIEVRGLAQ